MTTSRAGRSRTEAFLHRWRPILPLLVAEAIIWLGFGAILPILPLYMSDHGIDPVTLGLVMAAWPAARLVAEPLFGWLADRAPRVPFMVVGLLISTIVSILPLVLIGPGWFFAARFVSGIGAAMYDPAARGFIVDATDDESHGEAFGIYGAAQMGGFMVGPALGGLGGAALGIWFPFVFATVAGIVAAVYLGIAAREPGRHHARHGLTLPPADGSPGLATAPPLVPDGVPTKTIWLPPASMWNRMLVAAVVVNFGAFFASGTYEVVWSLFMQQLGASLELIGLSFAIFGVPVILLAPLVGRWVDRVGSLRFIVVGSVLIVLAAFAYPLVGDPYLVIAVSLVDAAGFALLSPAVYAVVSWGSPSGRSSTAQGVFGSAGTLGFIVSSLIAGELWSRGVALPFQAFGATMIVTTLIALAIGRGRLDGDDPSLMVRVPVGPSPGTLLTKEPVVDADPVDQPHV
jgi:DHA1 family multidrug resistance protein-like MFS transporter